MWLAAYVDAITGSRKEGHQIRAQSATGSLSAQSALATLVEPETLDIVINGIRSVVGFEPDQCEHRRRQLLGVGAVTSLSLLHALWMVPSGGQTALSDLPPTKARVLGVARGHVEVAGGLVTRRYAPAGSVTSVALTGRDGDALVDRAIRMSAIFKRYVLLQPGTSPPTGGSTCAAREWGIGIARVDENGVEVLVPAEPGVLGVPAVYRWWVAELAYRRWLQLSAQAES